MQPRKTMGAVACVTLALLTARTAYAADDLNTVLAKLDRAAAGFHTTAAEFEFDSVQSDPVPDTDVQKGVVYYERTVGAFRMGVHVREVNGKPTPKVIVAGGGKIQLYEPMIDQVTTLSKLSQYESWFMLGFGASGKELKEKWEIRYLGEETLDEVRTDKLELTPKDPAVRKNLPKVTMWIDPERGISLKQLFDEGEGQYRVSVYFDIKMNQRLPADAFTFKTDKATTFINR